MRRRSKDDLFVIEKRCAVTAFDLHVQVSRDGRERGLWIGLKDDSASRKKIYQEWLEGAIKRFFKFVKLDVTGLDDVQIMSRKFSAENALRHETGFMRSEVDDMALLEWDELQAVYDAIGKELKKRPKDS